MCFSAEVSFGASAVLTTIGVASIRKVQTPSQLPFASIPMLFAIQQFAEGMLWIALANPDYRWWQGIPTYVFLVFAQVVWPSLAPISILLLEKEQQQRKILVILSVIGVTISFYLAYCITFYDFRAEIIANHIKYGLDFPYQLSWLSGVIYFLPTVLPPFASSVKRMKILGLTILISYILTTVFFHEYIISIWCFFAAMLSAIIFSIISVLKDQSLEVKRIVLKVV